MNPKVLESLLVESVRELDIERACTLLVEYKKQGGEQYDAYELLSSLSERTDLDDVLLADLSDIVSGWCHPSKRIWEYPLGSRILLYEVRAIVQGEEISTLLPGVPISHLQRYNIQSLEKNDGLHLRLPDATWRITTVRGTHYVESRSSSSQIESDQVPFGEDRIMVQVPNSEDIPIGSELWYVRYSPQSSGQ